MQNPSIQELQFKPVLSQEEEPTFQVNRWPKLAKEAMPNLIGEIIQYLCQDSEADPAAILATLLTAIGNAIGDGPHLRISASKHSSRLFVAIVGASSRARKGTSAGIIKLILEMMNTHTPGILGQVSNGPLASGEGIIFQVRDVELVQEEDGNKQPLSQIDKRLLVIEGEFGSALRVSKREGNTLSGNIRTAWDGGILEPMTKKDRIKATNPHISIVAHITEEELRETMQKVDAYNGFGNRFLWICSRRPQRIALPKQLDETDPHLINYAEILVDIVQKARNLKTVPISKEAKELWKSKYDSLSRDDRGGMFGSITSRAEAQAWRLALLYCLMDREKEIGVDHLNAALAFWNYADKSAAYLFSEQNDNELEEFSVKIIELLETGPKSQTEITKACGNRNTSLIKASLGRLQGNGSIWQEKKDSPGRPITIWHITCEKSESVEKAS